MRNVINSLFAVQLQYNQNYSYDCRPSNFSLWSPYGIGQTIIFSSCGFFFLSFFLLFSSPISQRSEIGCLPYFRTWCGPSVNLECRFDMWCARLAGNAGHKKSPSGQHRTTLSGYIFPTKAHIDNRKKSVKQQYLPHMNHNMVNFGPLAAEFGSRLGSVTARYSSSGRQPNFAALNRGRHLCSAGRPSRWVLAHILVCYGSPVISHKRCNLSRSTHARPWSSRTTRPSARDPSDSE